MFIILGIYNFERNSPCYSKVTLHCKVKSFQYFGFPNNAHWKKSLLLFSGYHWFACTLTTSQTTTTFQPSKWLWRLEGAGVNWCFSWELTSFSLKIFWLKYLSYYTSTIRDQYIIQSLYFERQKVKKKKQERIIDKTVSIT